MKINLHRLYMAWRKFLVPVKAIGLIVVLLLSVVFAQATTYYGKNGTAPNLVASWGTISGGTGTAPTNFTTAGDVFIIESGTTMTATAAWLIGAAGTTASTLQINSGGTVAMGTYLLTLASCNFTNAGTFTSTTGGVTISGTLVANSIAGFTTTGAVTFTKTAGTTTLVGNLSAASFATTTTTTGSTFNLNGFTLALTGALTFARPSAAAVTLTVGSGTLNCASYTSTATSATRATVISISTGTVTISGTTTTTGGTGGIQFAFTGAGTLNFGGTTTGGTTATFTTVTGSTVNYSGAAQTTYSASYSNLTLSGSGAKTLQTGTTTISGNLVLSGSATTTTVANLTVGNLNVGDGTTFTAAGFNLTVSGTTTIGGGTSGILSITNATGTKIFTGSVTINGGGAITETATAALSFGSDVTINTSGTLTENGNAVVGIAGNLTNNGTYTASTGTHTFSGAANTIGGSSTNTIPVATFSGTYTNSGTLTVATLLTITGVTLTNNGIINSSTSLTGTGTLSNSSSGTVNITGGSCAITTNTNAGTFAISGTATSGTAVANFTNTGTINISGSGTITGITNNAAGIVNHSGSSTITSFNNATATSTLNISTTPTVPTFSTLTATFAGNTVNYNGAGNQTVKSTSYSNLIISGSGIKTLAAATSVASGALTVKAGTTFALSTYSLGATTAPTSVVLEIGTTGSAITGSGTLHLGGNVTVNYITGNSGATISCPINLDGTRTFSVADDGTAATDLTLSGVVANGSGTNGISKTDVGTMNLSGANTYSGPTSINAGTLDLGSTTALGTSSGTTVSSGAVLDLNGITLSSVRPLTLNGTGLTASPAGALTNTGGNASYSGAITLGSASTITATTSGTLTCSGTVGTGAYALTLDGVTGSSGTMSGAISTPTSVTKNGAGTWTLSGTNTYTGNTTVASGTLKLGASTTSLGTGAGITSVTSGAGLDLNGFTLSNAEQLTLNGTGISSGGALINGSATAATYNGAITLGSASSIGTTGNITLGSAGITGGQDLTKVGAATLSLGSGTATLGGLTISAGTLTSTTDTLNLAGNFTNSGTFAHNGGTVTFNGTTAQTLGGNTTAFNNLTISNTGSPGNNTVTLNTPISTSSAGVLTLTSGLLSTTTTNIPSVTNTGSSAISGGSATSFINGPVKWTLPASLGSGSTYNFPVGKGTTYLPFALINPTTSGTTSAQVEAFAAGSGGTYDGTLQSISTTEYWSLITAANFTNSSISVTRQNSISPLDAIGGYTGQTGPYTYLSGTTGVYGVAGSNPIGTNRFFVLAAKKSTITTITINGSPFCAGATGVSIPFTYDPKANFPVTTTFTAQLSDGSGSFSSPVILGSVASDGTGSQSLNVTIPSGTSAGTGYRIRIVSDIPAVTGSDNGTDIIISGAVAAQPGTITGSTTPCANATGFTYSVPNVSGVTYTWTFPSDWLQTGGGTSNSVTVTTGSASGNIQVTPSNSCGSGTPQTLAVSIVASPLITAQPSTIPQSVCQNSPLTTLSVSATGASSYQWYQNTTASNSGGTLLTGATSATYTPLSTTTGTTYYYCVVTGICSPTVASNVSGAVTVMVPQALTPVPASRCGTGTLNLSVTQSSCLPSSTINWFAASTGGTSLGSGTTFTTPSISATTTYYVEEGLTGGLTTLGATPLATTNFGLVFNLTEQIVLNSVTISASGTAGSITIGLRSNTGATISGVSDYTFTPIVGTQTVPLNWTIPAGTGYRILKTVGSMNLATTNPFSVWPIGFNVGSITGSYEGGTVTSRYDYFYNWSISRARVAVIATVGSPIVSGFSGSSCGSGPVALSASATAGTISWFAALTGGTALTTGTTYTPTLTATTTYYVESTDGTCTSSPRVPVVASIITPPTITASGNGTYCSGSTVTLSSSGTGLNNKYWTGPNGYYSLRDSVLTGVTSAMSGVYTVTGSALSGVNLVVNGNFESGNTGFGSSYGYAIPVANALQPEGLYTVVANPNSVHSGFSNCGDHTSGTGMQMVVNGATIGNVNIWSQTVNVVPNTAYQFTYWVQSVTNTNPSELQLYINGSPAGPVYTAVATTCIWKQFTYNWNSGSSTSAYLSLVNQNTNAGGNDFALDDIVFQPACTTTPAGVPPVPDPGVSNGGQYATSGIIYVNVSATTTAGAISSVQSICSGATPATLTSTNDGTGSGTITYEW